MRPEHHINPGRSADDLALVFLRHAAANGDLHIWVGILERLEMPEVAVEPVVGVLADRTGVEHHDIGISTGCHSDVTRIFEQAGQPLGVVHIHLAPVGAHLVRPHDVLAYGHPVTEQTERGALVRCLRHRLHGQIREEKDPKGRVPRIDDPARRVGVDEDRISGG